MVTDFLLDLKFGIGIGLKIKTSVHVRVPSFISKYMSCEKQKAQCHHFDKAAATVVPRPHTKQHDFFLF